MANVGICTLHGCIGYIYIYIHVNIVIYNDIISMFDGAINGSPPSFRRRIRRFYWICFRSQFKSVSVN